MKKILSLFLFVLLLHTGCTQQTFEQMANEMAGTVVKTIKPEEINPGTIMLDTREKSEFDVSHIEGAIWVGYDDFDFSTISLIPKNTQLIVYCSVGYRSGKIAEKLKDKGYVKVNNLWGGIFNWVNTGHTVCNKKGVTNKIHPYDPSWGKWLTKGVKTYE